MTEDRETGGGEPITEELLEKLTAQGEEGFDVEEILRRRGRRSSPGAAQGESRRHPIYGRPRSYRPPSTTSAVAGMPRCWRLRAGGMGHLTRVTRTGVRLQRCGVNSWSGKQRSSRARLRNSELDSTTLATRAAAPRRSSDASWRATSRGLMESAMGRWSIPSAVAQASSIWLLLAQITRPRTRRMAGRETFF